MPGTKSPRIHSIAREIWEEGNSPTETSKAILRREMVSVSPETLKNWAKAEGWIPWKEARNMPRNINPNQSFGVSGVVDPILRDCELIAKEYIQQHGPNAVRTRSGIKRIITEALEQVDLAKQPNLDTILYLRDVVLPGYCRNYAKFLKKHNETPAGMRAWTGVTRWDTDPDVRIALSQIPDSVLDEPLSYIDMDSGPDISPALFESELPDEPAVGEDNEIAQIEQRLEADRLNSQPSAEERLAILEEQYQELKAELEKLRREGESE